MQNYEISIKLLTELSEKNPLHNVIKMTLERNSLLDALISGIEQYVDDLLQYKNIPNKIIIEASGQNDYGEIYLEGHVEFGSFKWEKIHEGFPEFNEQGKTPFKIELKPIRPSHLEEKLIDYLKEAFPSYDFKYKGKSIFINIEKEWIDLFAFIKDLPKEMTSKLLVDDMKNRYPSETFKEYVFISNFILLMKDIFLNKYDNTIEINKLVSYDEYLEKWNRNNHISN